MVERLVAKAHSEKAKVAVAASGGRQHHIFAVWHADVAAPPEEVLVRDGFRKMETWIATFPNTHVSFDTVPSDPFMNINTPEELARAEDYIVEQGAMG